MERNPEQFSKKHMNCPTNDMFWYLKEPAIYESVLLSIPKTWYKYEKNKIDVLDVILVQSQLLFQMLITRSEDTGPYGQ